MERARKFGTFAGVFTPALLTIISVIMYLRLGWIVGQVGLIYTIGIILVANIISITTGLSLSSIATDKKIKAGGVYYMLSRSLGLPIGGAIGATIYLAFGLSIALNITGFSESFLSVEEVREFLNLQPGIVSYRIIGVSILVLLTIIAFISTSLAIKTQYVVLSAIVLSLIAIFGGLFMYGGSNSSTIILTPAPNAPSLAVIFAVFFPAATGFMMGASMSGDLKDPKKSIPKGTMYAIFTGLIINLCLAIGFAIYVDRGLLLTDSAFLKKIALTPILVIAGIWGATLSTALGGILGGPRVVQAMAKDGLAPAFLGKGHGVNNEPHRAILLTFVIAFSAILIGDLNTIARIATMFFITAYAFINLAFALESWASTDFRPSFRIPVWVGWTGFAASFIVMTQIDFMAMIIAFFLIWAVWFMMKRKQFENEPGDVWQSVWANVVRKSIHNIYVKGIEERNWKPNIMLFSGNPETRERLTELGKALIADHGLLSIIHLQQYKEGEKARPRFQQKLMSEESLSTPGVFNRLYFCNDIYHGIENLTETYGFAGVEPNTVLMGWTRNMKEGVRFVKMIKRIIDLDMNLLLLDYDTRRGFGDRNVIDIWWQGSGNNGNLALNLVKFLWLSEGWKDSHLRLMIENKVNDDYERVFSFAREVLDNLRINADIVIINNEIEDKPFYDLIRIESASSDITFLSIPEIEEGRENEFLEKMYMLCTDIGSVVLIKASTQFKRLNIGLSATAMPLRSPVSVLPAAASQSQWDINWPAHYQLTLPLKDFASRADVIGKEMIMKNFGKVFNEYAELIQNANNRVQSTFNIISRRLAENVHYKGTDETLKAFYKLSNNTFTRYEQILEYTHDTLLPQQQQELEALIYAADKQLTDLISEMPEVVQFTAAPQADTARDDWGGKIKKLIPFTPATATGKKVYLRKVLNRYYMPAWQLTRKKIWQRFSVLSQQYVVEQQQTFRRFRDTILIMENALNNQMLSQEMIENERREIDKVFKALTTFIGDSVQNLISMAGEEHKTIVSEIIQILENPSSTHGLQHRHHLKKNEIKAMETYPYHWRWIQQLKTNQNLLDNTLSSIEYKLWHFMKRAQEEISNSLYNTENPAPLLLSPRIIDFTNDNIRRISKGQPVSPPLNNAGPDQEFHQKIKDIEETLIERINTIISKTPDKTELLKTTSPTDFTLHDDYTPDTQVVEVSRLVHFIVQNNLLAQIPLILKEFSLQAKHTENEIIEIIRLISFTITSEKDEPLAVPMDSFLAEQKKRSERVREKVNDLITSTQDKLQASLNTTSRLLHITRFLKTAGNLMVSTKNAEPEESSRFPLKSEIDKVQHAFRKQIVELWYDRSKRIVQAEKQNYEGNTVAEFPISKMHTLNEHVSVSSDVLNAIPPYYQQLFLRKNNYFMDFWHGKPNELADASKAIDRHQRGFNGGLLVRGENSSGKSFFVNYVVHKYLTNKQVFVITPPFGGSASEAEFVRSFQRATETSESVRKTLEGLSEKSVIIIEDLELWWEKTMGGFKVIKLITTLIEEFGNKILFILTVNSHASRSISRFVPLGSYMLGTIDCTPYNAEELKNIILQRHRSGSMQFVFHHTKEAEMHSWDYARLFNTYFNYTRGNVGLSLQTWMACIEKVEGNTIYIRSPRRPDTSVLNTLKPDLLIFLVQFILHKRLTYEKIQRIMLMPLGEVKEKIRLLKRAALITEPQQGVYILNPNLHAFIRERFIEKELL
jgi:amino acid transporter